jgi:hypothetical protein
MWKSLTDRPWTRDHWRGRLHGMSSRAMPTQPAQRALSILGRLQGGRDAWSQWVIQGDDLDNVMGWPDGEVAAMTPFFHEQGETAGLVVPDSGDRHHIGLGSDNRSLLSPCRRCATENRTSPPGILLRGGCSCRHSDAFLDMCIIPTFSPPICSREPASKTWDFSPSTDQ